MELYIIKHLLDNSINQKKIYSFHEYGDENYFCGYVLSYNSDTIQIQHYTKFGENDGILTLPFANIKRIGTQGEYHEGLQFLIDNNALLVGSRNAYTTLSPPAEGFSSTLKQYESNRKDILNLEINNEYYIGFMEEVNDYYIIFTEIDNAGFVIETAMHRTSDVTIVRINDKAGRKAQLLYNWRKNIK